MGLLSDKMNENFDKRIAIAKKLGIKVHGDKMMKFQINRIIGDPKKAMITLKKSVKKKNTY